MNLDPSILNNLRIASPCSASWDEMRGDERVRFCAQCKLHVYNFSSMKRVEIESLLVRTEGRVCVRFYRWPDGTVLTSDCPVGMARMKATAQRVLTRIAAVFGLVLTSLTTAACARYMGVPLPSENRTSEYHNHSQGLPSLPEGADKTTN
jgi:hypothetical protein